MATVLGFMLAARRSEMQGLIALELTCELVGGISRLVHALQRERGFSNMYLSARAERFRQPLDQLTSDSRGLEQSVRRGFNRMDPETGRGADKARLFNRIALVLHGLDGLACLRRRVRDQALSPQESTRAFTRVIGGLLAVVFEAADTSVDPDITRCLVALFNFMQGKELAGLERATGVAGFASGLFDLEQLERLQYLGEGQQRCFAIFCDYADKPALNAWHQLCTDPVEAEIARLRLVAARSLPGQPLEASLGEPWFELTTRRIDAMKQVEDLLTERLQQLCQQKIRQAQADLDNHRCLLERLDQFDDASDPPGTRLFNVQATELDGAPGDTMGQQLNRSVLDLLHEQNQRLQMLAEELDNARSSLNERKLIERAKGVLMSRHGLDEEASYRILQNAAMERSQRLADVAQAVLSLADLMPNANTRVKAG